ncbi:MAG: dihydropteroate synthase [Bryobacteraceae bacterium]
MARKRCIWKLKDREIQLGDRTLLMGVLNVTPDSFSDGGALVDPDRAYAHAVRMEEEGADIIDVGAESTRPGSSRISEDEELKRLVPVLKRLRGKLTIPISVDTYKGAVAERAIDLGAEIINDPSGLTWDPQVARTAALRDAGLVINHMRGTPDTWAKMPAFHEPAEHVVADLRAAVHRAVRAGLDPARIVVDPGLGFGKRKEENSRLIAELQMLAQLEVPILAGPSRKSFLAQTEPEALLMATAAAVASCVLNGAHIVRVHDVKQMMPVVQVADAVARGRPEPRD